MTNPIEVEITDVVVQQFIEEKAGPTGLFSSPADYIRDLIRRDFEAEEKRRWNALYDHLRPGIEADDSVFVPLDIDDVIKRARSQYEAGES